MYFVVCSCAYSETKHGCTSLGTRGRTCGLGIGAKPEDELSYFKNKNKN